MKRSSYRNLVSNAAFGLVVAGAPLAAQDADEQNESMVLQQTSNQIEAQEIASGIFKATGFGNTFLVTTSDGSVVIDTSLAGNAAQHKNLLQAQDPRDPRYIIITHAHGDHIGGVAAWQGPGTAVVQHSNAEEFMHYQTRLTNFFKRRNAAQFGFDLAEVQLLDSEPGNFAANIPANILVDDRLVLKLGELTFEVIATPSETLDAISVWIPERKAVFVGDLYYQSFQNIYTLRGTKPRWALDYVASLDRIIALNAELLIPSHGEPVEGLQQVRSTLQQYRDAVLYVHDETVSGMNAGKSVEELVEEIKLPEALNVGEAYGTVGWSVRGIYEGYAGWFDGNASTMLEVSPAMASGELVALANGAVAVLTRAAQVFETGDSRLALALVDSVLEADKSDENALRLKIEILQKLLPASRNFNEAGWIGASIREAQAMLGAAARD